MEKIQKAHPIRFPFSHRLTIEEWKKNGENIVSRDVEEEIEK